MLKTIVIITISVLNIEPVQTAYETHFGYEEAQSGTVTADLAAAWGAPGAARRPFVMMGPASGASVYLRFVEGDDIDGYAPLMTPGWNATELLVKDPDALAARLADGSPFEIIGPPKDLWDAPNAPRAMQTLGPGNEILYLTRNGRFPTASDVDRVFIMVLGGASIAELGDYYRGLGLSVGDPTPFRISVLSRARGLPVDTTYPLAIATLSDDFLIEFDEYPEGAAARPVVAGQLPPGVAMVAFETTDLDALDLSWNTEPRAIAEFPYNGRRVAVTVGPAGEWLELIETP
jgi:hypothetical protein